MGSYTDFLCFCLCGYFAYLVLWILHLQYPSTTSWEETATKMINKKTTKTEYQLQVSRIHLSGIVQTVARDLSMKLEWAPYLSAAPAAICVMATCLVAGSSGDADIIEIKLPKCELRDRLGVKESVPTPFFSLLPSERRRGLTGIISLGVGPHTLARTFMSVLESEEQHLKKPRREC